MFYQSEIWDAARNEPITTGEEVEIVGFDDMKLLVRRKVDLVKMKKRGATLAAFCRGVLLIRLLAGGRYLIQQRSDREISVTVPKLSPAAKGGRGRVRG